MSARIPRLSDLVGDWLKEQDLCFSVDGGWLVCKCEATIGLISDTTVAIEMAANNNLCYSVMHAADPEFFIKLQRQLMRHVCRHKVGGEMV